MFPFLLLVEIHAIYIAAVGHSVQFNGAISVVRPNRQAMLELFLARSTVE